MVNAVGQRRWSSAWGLFGPKEPVALPTFSRDPRLGGHDWGIVDGERWARGGRLSPARKPPSRRARIEAFRDRLASGRVVLAAVQKDIHESVAHFPWCFEGSRMVPLAPDSASPAERAIESARKSHRQPVHTARQRAFVVCLDNHMNVIGLHGKLHDAEPRARCPRERAAQGDEQALFTQTW